MLRTGLVSVTFRKLTVEQVIELCVKCGLEGIEWGGDVHVPHGDVERAAAVGEATRAAGLEVACYGSYYRCDGETPVPFERVLESAVALRAPVIRVWAGQKGSQVASEDEWAKTLADLRRISELAAAKGIRIATEYHGHTLTDTRAGCRRVLDEVDNTNFGSLWQPLRRSVGDAEVAENLEDLEDVIPRLSHVHVYEWAETEPGKRAMIPIQADGQWASYVERLKQLDQDVWMLLEFVPGDTPEVLPCEAATLKILCS